MVPVFHPLADKLNLRYQSLELIQHQNPALAYKIYEDLGAIDKVIDQTNDRIKSQVKEEENNFLLAFEQRMS